MGRKKKKVAQARQAVAVAVPNTLTREGVSVMALEVTCTNTQKVPITVTPQNAQGQPAVVDGPLRLSVLSGDGTIQQDPVDPMKFRVISGASAGVSEFGVEVDARIGPEEVLIGDRVLLTVTLEEATSLGMVAGAPEPK